MDNDFLGDPRDDFMIAPNGEDTTVQTPDGDLLRWPPRPLPPTDELDDAM
jgi:hypothetical protein